MNDMTEPIGEVLISHGVPSGPVTYVFADSADREPGSDVSLTNDIRTMYGINAVPTNKPTYKARFEFISKCKIFYVDDANLANEYENYQYEYINGIPTERPIKKNDHYMNAVEYCLWGMKEYFGIMW